MVLRQVPKTGFFIDLEAANLAASNFFPHIDAGLAYRRSLIFIRLEVLAVGGQRRRGSWPERRDCARKRLFCVAPLLNSIILRNFA